MIIFFIIFTLFFRIIYLGHGRQQIFAIIKSISCLTKLSLPPLSLLLVLGVLSWAYLCLYNWIAVGLCNNYLGILDPAATNKKMFKITDVQVCLHMIVVFLPYRKVTA